MRPAFFASEVWTGLRRSLSMAVSIVLVTMVSLFFVGLGVLAERQVDAAKGYWYDRVEVSIFLCPAQSNEPACASGAVTSAQRLEIAALLDSMKPTVASYEFESQEAAYQRFREQFKNDPTFAQTPQAAIPAAFRVKLSDPQDYRVVRDAFEGMPGVAQVKDIREVLDPLFNALDVLKQAAWGLAGVMSVCTVLLVSTTIRMVAWTRRRETHIKRMVGASKAAIRLPFVAETLLATLLGAGLAVGALWGLVRYGVSHLAERFRDFAWISTPDVWSLAPLLVLASVVLSALVSWLAVSRHVRL